MMMPGPDTAAAAAAVPLVNGCFLDRLLRLAAERGLGGDRDRLASAHGVRGDGFTLDTVLAVADDLGLAARHTRLSWAGLAGLADHLPALLIFRDGATAILDGLEPAVPPPGTPPARVLLRDDGAADRGPAPPLALERDDLALFWAGDVIVPATGTP
ncbi:hypothetical protein [Roseospira goensis]|uniref:Peptidase C39 domain-containing protein n=1 Tax=Roseospira goensis TaxID=391922 RepID=A0A7W6RX56_9PROT|nr:hypothetical protein [Roseospira goensis]MBB4284350.1 hypothetical protein [Roseospira goensis]